MSKEIHVGDRVITTYSCSGTTQGREYTVYRTGDGDLAISSFGAGDKTHYCVCQESWELVEKVKKTFMKTVSTMMKKLLDADTQTLVKAGFINGDLELTSEGEKALKTILFVANKKALVDEANAVIAEEKK